MSNVKISALPSTTATTFNDWVIKNDSGETTTSKAQLKDVLGMTSLNGNDAIQSSSWLTSLGTTANTQSAIAIGNGAEATSPYSIAIGHQALNQNRDGNRDYYICIGFDAQAVQGATALGRSARAIGADTVAIGISAIASGNGAFALGNSAFADNSNSVSIGNSASNFGQNQVSIGPNSLCNDGDSSVAIGHEAVTRADDSVSIGFQANLGTGATYGVAVGSITNVNNQYGIAIGRDADVDADFGIAIGGQTDVTGSVGVALGHQADVTAEGGVALGYLSVADQTDSVALGPQINTDFANTTKTRSVQSTGQFFNRVQQLGSGTTFNINWNDGGSVELTLTGNSTCTLSNVRDGGIYRVKVTTTGTQSLTPTASGYTFVYQGGGFTFTPNGTDLCILHVFGTQIMVTHFADFS
jgi:hypothetical protein